MASRGSPRGDSRGAVPVELDTFAENPASPSRRQTIGERGERGRMNSMRSASSAGHSDGYVTVDPDLPDVKIIAIKVDSDDLF